MGDEAEVKATLQAVSARLEENTRMTQELSHKLDLHKAEHEAINRHIDATRRHLYEGYEGQPGLITQARDCFLFRQAAASKIKGFIAWAGVVGGIMAGLGTIGLLIVNLISKHI